LNLWKSFTVSETRVFQAADGEDLVILACTVFDWFTRVMDRQTDRIAMAKTCYSTLLLHIKSAPAKAQLWHELKKMADGRCFLPHTVRRTVQCVVHRR